MACKFLWLVLYRAHDLIYFSCYHLEYYSVVYKVYMLRLQFHPNLNKVWSVDLSIPVQHAKREEGWCSGHTTQKANSLFACSTPAAHKQQLQISLTIWRPCRKEQLHCLLCPPTNLNSKRESQKFKYYVFIKLSMKKFTMFHQTTQ